MAPHHGAQLPSLTAEEALISTAEFTSVHAGLYPNVSSSGPWLVTGAVLMAQQAATMALTKAGDHIPSKAGATELVLRAASKDRLPAPYTLRLSLVKRQAFDRLVAARNSFMHPRGESWHIMPDTLARGLKAAVSTVRHLILVQPVTPHMIPARDETRLSDHLVAIESLAEFFED